MANNGGERSLFRVEKNGDPPRPKGYGGLLEGSNSLANRCHVSKEHLITALFCIINFATATTTVLIGMILLDLQILTGTTSADTAWLFTVKAFGLLIGIAITGCSQSCLHIHVLVMSWLFAGAFLVMPFCRSLFSLLGVFLAIGISYVSILSVGTLCMAALWKKKKSKYIYIITLGGYLGYFLGPSLSLPFVSKYDRGLEPANVIGVTVPLDALSTLSTTGRSFRNNSTTIPGETIMPADTAAKNVTFLPTRTVFNSITNPFAASENSRTESASESGVTTSPSIAFHEETSLDAVTSDKAPDPTLPKYSLKSTTPRKTGPTDKMSVPTVTVTSESGLSEVNEAKITVTNNRKLDARKRKKSVASKHFDESGQLQNNMTNPNRLMEVQWSLFPLLAVVGVLVAVSGTFITVTAFSLGKSAFRITELAEDGVEEAKNLPPHVVWFYIIVSSAAQLMTDGQKTSMAESYLQSYVVFGMGLTKSNATLATTCFTGGVLVWALLGVYFNKKFGPSTSFLILASSNLIGGSLLFSSGDMLSLFCLGCFFQGVGVSSATSCIVYWVNEVIGKVETIAYTTYLTWAFGDILFTNAIGRQMDSSPQSFTTVVFAGSVVVLLSFLVGHIGYAILLQYHITGSFKKLFLKKSGEDEEA